MTKNSKIIIQEAEALGLNVEIISEKKHLFIIRRNNYSMTVCELFSMTLDPNSEAYRLSKDKDITYSLWQKAGVPFPQYYHFSNLGDFLEKIEALKLTFPLITKEGSGSKSINVHMDIRSREELRRVVQSYHKSIIVQQMAVGNEYRLLLYKERLLGALQMIPPHIIGTGKNTVAELIAEANLLKIKEMKVSDHVLVTLSKAGFTLDSVLKKGEVFTLQKNSRISEGGTTRDCTKIVNKEIVALAWRAVAATNLNLGGIDLICSDISAPVGGQQILFLEVNTYPDLSIHYSPTIGESQPVVKFILQDVFKLDSQENVD